MASRLTYFLESSNALPNEHYGFRPKRSTMDAIDALLTDVRLAWASRKKVSALFIDFKGAFDRVPHDAICKKLDTLRAPAYLSNWVASFLHSRSGRIQLEGYTGPLFYLPVGVPQGSPLSPILFIMFNGDVLEVIKQAQIRTNGTKFGVAGGRPAGFADDISLWIVGDSLESNVIRLTAIGSAVLHWAQSTGQFLESTKTVLMHFSREHRALESQPWVQIDGVQIKPTNSTRFLGLVVDKRLTWVDHVKARVQTALQLALGS